MNKHIKQIVSKIKGLDYRESHDKIRMRDYNNGETHVGYTDNISTALATLYGDHWVGEADTSKLGFIYKVTDTREKRFYIGRKQYSYYDKKTDSYKYDHGWTTYTSSSAVLKEEYTKRPEDFVFQILLNCENREQMGYAEFHLIAKDFDTLDCTGERVMWNGVVPKLFYQQLAVSDSFKAKVANVL